MNDIIGTLIASLMGAGGGLAAVITIFMNRSKENKSRQKADIDDRIAEWKRIADMHETEMKEVKEELKRSEMNNKSLELYIRELTLLLAKVVPPVEIPPYPALIVKNE